MKIYKQNREYIRMNVKHLCNYLELPWTKNVKTKNYQGLFGGGGELGGKLVIHNF